jgi:molybdate transport system ATP-binding protein
MGYFLKGMVKFFIKLDDITVRLQDRLILQNSFWQIEWDQHWAILGPNGSGKSTLVRALWGGVLLYSGRVLFGFGNPETTSDLIPQRETIGYVSFETHQRLMEHEEMLEELREFAGKKDEITTMKDVILSGISTSREVISEDEKRLDEIAHLLGIRHLLQRGITLLSTGEMRKTLIARALIKSPKLLILDEPFDGLDEAARALLSESINQLMTTPIRVILVTHKVEEIVPNITHVLFVKNGRLFMQGPKEEMLTSEKVSKLFRSDLKIEKMNERYRVSYGIRKNKKVELAFFYRGITEDVPDLLIEIKDTTVRYGDFLALDQLNWTMKRGENWTILGPNGSGKSTILRLILGENLQGYANQVTIFGRRKGTGETLWEIKRRIGVVSSELQIQYRKKMSAYDVIASGFYDSIGLYQYPTKEQRVVADGWIELLSIGDIAKEPYHRLSYGQKRMILLARAMVKPPLLLILDEPCHGLDLLNRRKILDIVEMIGETKTNILYVTNHKDEILNCMTHVMRLQKGKVLSQGRKEDVMSRYQKATAQSVDEGTVFERPVCR